MFKVKEIKTEWIYTVYGINKNVITEFDKYDDVYRTREVIEFLIFYNNYWQWIDSEEVVPY